MTPTLADILRAETSPLDTLETLADDVSERDDVTPPEWPAETPPAPDRRVRELRRAR